ncbi:MAG TPA: hypothetical protein VM223_27155 [Planctomycetota bacterium]|nr:hypothetical protein [Planctomycetota bacterium]
MPVEVGAGQEAIKKWQFYPTVLGRDVYNKRSITAQARSTVSDLVSFIIAGAQYEDTLPFELREVAERLIVDGPVVIEDPGVANRFVDDCYAPDAQTLYKYLRSDTGALELHLPGDSMDQVYTKLVQVFTLSDGKWSEKIIKNMGSPSQRTELKPSEVDPRPVALDMDSLFVYPNGRGELYWAQHVFHAIDEIAETMRNVGSGINLLPIISGNVGSPEQAKSAIRDAVNAIIFPGDVTVDRVVSEAIINQLIRESEMMLTFAKDAMNAVEKDTPNRPVAADRELRSRAMTEFVRLTRGKIARIYAKFGVDVGFDPFVVKSAEERSKELDILERVLARAAITNEEAKQQMRALVGLGMRDTAAAENSHVPSGNTTYY